VHGLLAECDSSPSVSEMPVEDRQGAFEPMCLATGIDYELQGNVVRRAAVSKHGLRTDGATVVGKHRLRECRLPPKRSGPFGEPPFGTMIVSWSEVRMRRFPFASMSADS
jgi:hypothetical protein